MTLVWLFQFLAFRYVEDGPSYQLEISPECINLRDISLLTYWYNDPSSWNSSTSLLQSYIYLYLSVPCMLRMLDTSQKMETLSNI